MLKTLTAMLRLMRPHQWLKNSFVLAGVVFSQQLMQPELLWQVLRVFAAFCCMASLVYVLNDWRDRASDARHPKKRHRPLANGTLSPAIAGFLALILGASGLYLAHDNRVLLALLGLYLLFNLAYSAGLKHVPIVDVSLIAAGFMLRLLAGTVAVGIAPSRWLLLTGLFVALFLGFSKRKAEGFHQASAQRAVLEHYPSALLDTLMAVTMTATLTTYSLYATSAETLAQHGERLIYTVPLVVFALMRYVLQVHRGHGEDVSRDVLRDPWIAGAALAYLALLFWPRATPW